MEPAEETKADIRREAFARRKDAQNETCQRIANRHLTEFLLGREGAVVAGYMAIRTEIDPRATLEALHQSGRRIVLPVIQGKGRPLLFRSWSPDSPMIEGDFGALIPRGGEILEPDTLIVPLVGFDGAGNRLGYGGGFYDRSLAGLRARRLVHAVGFAFAGQELPRIRPEPTDQRLDAVVTESGARLF